MKRLRDVGLGDLLAFGRLAALWIPAGLAGWLLFRVLGGPAAAVAAEAGLWLVATAVAVGIGLLLSWLVPGGRRNDPALTWAAVTAVGFGIAISAGWTIVVDVGGPATGLAVAVALAGCHRRAHPARIVPAMAAGMVGIVLGRLLAEGMPTAVRPALTIGCGLLALGLALFLLDRRMPFAPIAVLVAAWGLAWVALWFVTTRLVTAYSVHLAEAAEIVVAIGLGGLATGVAWRGRTGERPLVVAIRWAGFAALGYALSWGVAALVWLVGLTPGELMDVRDVGTVVGLAVGAWFAVLPTMHAAAASRARGGRLTVG